MAALIIGAALTGCADDSGVAVSAADATSTPAVSPTTSTGSTPIILELDGTAVTGRLDEGAAAASLLDQLPLSVSLSDFGGQEKVAELPEPLDLEGAPAGSGAEPGMIGYYVPDQRLILYYDEVGYYAGIVPLGTFDDVAAVETVADGSVVTVRRSR